jgi:Rps23 Pro-64 3,4-dihydroxylase Tpa1-like proline 4-hydroxylase
MFNYQNIANALDSFKGSLPFDHCVIDDFFHHDLAMELSSQFLPYDDQKWFYYKNPIEDKKALNDWNAFPSMTYKVFRELVSPKFVEYLSKSIGIQLYPDPGLHGGGWHIHSVGGNLNPHLDYSIHPKVGLQRKLNIIIYMSSDLEESHGGHLGLWSHDVSNKSPLDLVQEVQPIFNRAVLFDTTQNSWHGMSRPLTQPEGVYRKSLAVYYLTDPPTGADMRERALFAPRESQKGDEEISEIIRIRSDASNYSKAYRTDKS